MTELLNDFLTGSVAWGVLLTLAAFGLGVLINRVTGKAIFNPLLLGSIFVIIFLSMCNIPYGDYKTSAAPVSYLLLPATVALAVPLYEKLDLLKGECARHHRRHLGGHAGQSGQRLCAGAGNGSDQGAVRYSAAEVRDHRHQHGRGS